MKRNDLDGVENDVEDPEAINSGDNEIIADEDDTFANVKVEVATLKKQLTLAQQDAKTLKHALVVEIKQRTLLEKEVANYKLQELTKTDDGKIVDIKKESVIEE